jgi:hypothetical protein
MTVAAAQFLVQVSILYVGVGGAFAAMFLWRWVGRLDSAAEHGTWGFRVLAFPGVAVFWPLFLVRLLYGSLVLKLSAYAGGRKPGRFRWERRCRQDQHKRAME